MGDMASLLLKRITDILIIKNPVGTAMGGIFGYLSQVACSLFETSKNIASTINPLAFILLGIFIFNIRTWWKKDEVDEQVVNKIDFIEQMKKTGKIDEIEAKLYYRNIINNYLESMPIDDKVKSNSPEISE